METFDEWINKYKPLKNDNGKIILFDTYGSDIELVKNQTEKNIWTLKSGFGENGRIEYDLNAGFFHCDRVGYFITEIPIDWNNNEEVNQYASFCVYDDFDCPHDILHEKIDTVH